MTVVNNSVHQLPIYPLDQAIHIAARQDSFEVGRLLIEFDASIDTRNYEGLTPIGVARMNRNIHFVHLLNSHYISVRENYERVKFQRTGFSSICSQKVLRQEANKKRLEAQLERWKHLQKNIAAGCIQQQVRKLLVLRARERMFIKIECANLIQMKWRWRHRDEVYRQRQRSARIIQSFERMRIIKNNFINFHQEGLRLYRASRILACVAQRLWRGHLGRATLRRKIEVKNLPDPNDVKSFDSWLSIQKIANPPARTWGVYAEYYLSGYPRNWPERNTIKRHEMFYRDVRFYSHIVTRRVTWSQPETWKNFDKKNL